MMHFQIISLASIISFIYVCHSRCTDKCYYVDETLTAGGAHTCITDCDCLSIRTCSEYGWCEGDDTYSDPPSCTKAPTQSPTNDPTHAPTTNPTPTPTNNPTYTPTSNPTPSPTINPTPSPTFNPTPSPTINPTLSPTNNPITVQPITASPTTTFPTTAFPTTVFPTTAFPTTLHPTMLKPTSMPTTVNPTASSHSLTTSTKTTTTIKPSSQPTPSPTSTYKYVHFICSYNEDRDYIAEFVTSINYAKIMIDVILSSVQTITVTLGKWEKSGILDFSICSVFNSKLSHFDIECPADPKSNHIDDDKGQYIAIGIFGFFVNDIDKLNEYKRWMIEQMESNAFKNAFNNNMNNKLSDIILNGRIKRILLEYDRFEAVQIDVIDPNNTTISSTQNAEDLKGSEKNIKIIIVAICLLIVIIIIVLVIYFKRTNKKNKQIEENEGVWIGNNIEMVEHGKEIEGIQKKYVTQNNNENAHQYDDIIEKTNDTTYHNEQSNGPITTPSNAQSLQFQVQQWQLDKTEKFKQQQQRKKGTAFI